MSRKAQKLILASRSPARFQILKDAGLKLTRAFADIDETPLPGESTNHHALRLAVSKAKKISETEKNAIIIAADTIIIHNKKIFGRPANKTEAREMLKTLSGKWHEVHTGTVVLNSKTGKTLKKLVVTRVKFAKLNSSTIEWYIKTGEPLKAAGAYSVQGKGRTLVKKIDGCFTNVIGISIPVVMEMLEKL